MHQPTHPTNQTHRQTHGTPHTPACTHQPIPPTHPLSPTPPLQAGESRDALSALYADAACKFLDAAAERAVSPSAENSAAAANSKFAADGFEGGFGELADFLQGPEAVLGQPGKDALAAMRREHASAETFTPGNYGVTTCPRDELAYVLGEAGGRAAPGSVEAWRACDGGEFSVDASGRVATHTASGCRCPLGARGHAHGQRLQVPTRGTWPRTRPAAAGAHSGHVATHTVSGGRCPLGARGHAHGQRRQVLTRGRLLCPVQPTARGKPPRERSPLLGLEGAGGGGGGLY